ncbi:MAG TPA: TfoX/Sxy family protein [Patescibacteria group bacterium]|nr:TfoX/Sxy family protein [Patescibacteria group bacterium]
MASMQSTADLISERMGGAGTITYKKMFGEFALYCNGKVVAFICDDALFIKPTPQGREFYPEAEDAPPYPGAKMYLLIPEEKWEDTEFMSELCAVTYAALPAPKPKRRKK